MPLPFTLKAIHNSNSTVPSHWLLFSQTPTFPPSLFPSIFAPSTSLSPLFAPPYPTRVVCITSTFVRREDKCACVCVLLMSLRGWGHSVRRLSPCTISRYLRNTQKISRFSWKHTHTQTWTEADKLQPSFIQHLFYLWPFNYTQLQRKMHTFIFFKALLCPISQSVSSVLAITQLLPLTSGIALSLCSQLALSGCCPVCEATVIYHPAVKWRGLAGRPALISEIYSVQGRLLRGKLFYKHRQLFIR